MRGEIKVWKKKNQNRNMENPEKLRTRNDIWDKIEILAKIKKCFKHLCSKYN